MFKMKRICHLIFRLLFLLDGGVWSLKNLSISVPRAVLSGEREAVLLRCSYDLEGAALYSIRWYRAETEFYRYVPREMPPSMVFPLPGAEVDLTQSDSQQVRISSMHRRLSGDYQCEVSADAPLFHTDIRSAPLTVVDPPFRAPQLTLSRESYARGDVIRANCSVDESYPAANISWLLDDHKIAETVARPPPPGAEFRERGAASQLEISVGEVEPHRAGLLPASGGLAGPAGGAARGYRYPGDPPEDTQTLRYLLAPPASGQFSVSCAASILDVWARRAAPRRLREDAPRPASVTGDDSAGAGAAASSLLLLLGALPALLAS